jgi:TonB family protein
MFQPGTKHALRVIWPGIKACVTWMVHMGLFTGLMWLAAQLPKEPVAIEEPEPERACKGFAAPPPKELPVLEPVELSYRPLRFQAEPEEECPTPPQDEECPKSSVEEGIYCFPRFTPPKLIFAEKLRYTPEALKARVQGVIIAKCIISCRGEVKQCRIIKGLPHMNQAALTALQSRRYEPMRNKGRAVSTSFVFSLKVERPK